MIPEPTTIADLADYVACGDSIRHRDASPKTPSPVLSAMQVLEIARREMGAK